MKRVIAISGGVALILLTGAWLAWQRGWFSDEPTFAGKTVTRWLDNMPLLADWRESDRTKQTRFTFPNTAAGVTNDPAIRAIQALGAAAVPVLIRRLTPEPRSPTLSEVNERLLEMARSWWQGKTNFPPVQPLPPGSREEARSEAAALGLMTLSTNAGGGFLRLAEKVVAYQLANPQHSNNLSLSANYWIATHLAGIGWPELAGQVRQCLWHTNAAARAFAANATRSFPKQMPLWRARLLELAKDPSEGAQDDALWALATQISTDPDVLSLCHETLGTKTNSLRLRRFAATGLNFAGASATNSLPLLRAILIDNAEDRHVKTEARRAIQSIEKAANQSAHDLSHASK